MSLMILFGLTATVCTTVSFLPQVVKIIKTKETKDISLPMYAILTIGLFLWLIYGLMMKDMPIILANAISFGLVTTVLILKVKHG